MTKYIFYCNPLIVILYGLDWTLYGLDWKTRKSGAHKDGFAIQETKHLSVYASKQWWSSTGNC